MTATAAGGTHPTGMHSCFILFFKNVFVKAPNVLQIAKLVKKYINNCIVN